MKKLMCLLMMIVLLSSVQAAITTLVNRSEFVGHEIRVNAADYECGNFFTTGNEPLVVTALGYIDMDNANVHQGTPGPNDGDGLKEAHRVTLWLASTQAKIAEVTVPAGTVGTLYDGFRYADLPTPLVLQSNTQYMVSSVNGSPAGDCYVNATLNPGPVTPNAEFIGSTTDWTYYYVTPSNQYPTTTWNQRSFYGLANVLSDPSAPYDPVPAYLSEGGGVKNGNFVDVDLSWKAGQDPAGVAPFNPAIKKHYVYISNDQYDSVDPNLFYEGTVDQVSLTDPNAGLSVAGLNLDGQYLWQVEEGLDNGLGGVYGPGDPNNILGPVWIFDTVKSIPVIDVQPQDVLADLDEPVAISITVSSISTETYQWYKSDDNSNETSGDDTPVGTNSNVLDLGTAEVADEGFYYCEVTNDGGMVPSDVAKIAVKRLLAYWTLDGLVADQYSDSSSEDPVADNVDPNNASLVNFVPGPYSLGAASAISVDESSFGTVSTAFHPTQYSGQLTISAWIRLTSPLGATNLYGIVGEGTGAVNNADNFVWSLNARNRTNGAGPSVRIISWSGLDAWSSADSISEGEWAHVVATVGDGGATMYVNGLPDGNDQTPVFGNEVDAPVRIGDFGSFGYKFPGDIDDIKVYNFGMDQFQVADLYNEVSGINLCIQEYADALDFANGDTGLIIGDEGFQPDCKVNIYDFAAFSSSWLDCGLYPACD